MLLLKLHRELDALSLALPEIHLIDRWRAAVADALLVDLTSPAGLRSIGVAAESPAVVLPGFGGSPWIVVVTLADRARFESWLVKLARGRRHQIDVAGARADVLFEDSDWPVACATRDRTAYCQIGAGVAANPASGLRRLLESKIVPAREVRETARALAGLPTDADLYVVARPGALSPRIAELVIEHAERRNRFNAADRRQADLRGPRALAARIRTHGRSLEALGASLSIEPNRISARADLALDDRAARAVNAIAPPEHEDDPVARWSDTPALGRVLVRMRQEAAHALLSQLGLRLPQGAVAGSFAALALGLDTECPSAKTGAPGNWLTFGLAMPVAAAIGLRRGVALDELKEGLPEELAPVAKKKEDGAFRGQVFGSPVEIREAEGAILFGTGPGGGSAAARRWASLGAAPKAPATAPTFLEVGVDLAAVRAAVAAVAFSDDTRPELRLLERWQRRFHTVAGSRYRAIAAHGVALDQGRRVRFDLSLRMRGH